MDQVDATSEVGASKDGESSTTSDVLQLLRAFCDTSERGDRDAFSGLFTEDGVYHDVFYGAFVGRARIAEFMDICYRAGADYRWDMHEPVTDGSKVYARYLFSYRSLMPEANGARAVFEGVSILKLRDGQITEYREVADTTPALVAMNFAPERIARIAAKNGHALRARPEARRHIAT